PIDSYALSLHDALPIFRVRYEIEEFRRGCLHDYGLGVARLLVRSVTIRDHLHRSIERRQRGNLEIDLVRVDRENRRTLTAHLHRSEEHTSELQSLAYLV